MPNIFGVHISKTTAKQVEKNIDKSLRGNCPYVLYTPNPEILQLAEQNIEYRDILNTADMLLPDGIGVYVGYKILDSHLPKPLKYCMLPIWTLLTFLRKTSTQKKYGEKITGSDTLKTILTLATKHKKNVVILDNEVKGIWSDFDILKQEGQKTMTKKLAQIYPGLRSHLHFWEDTNIQKIQEHIAQLDYPVIVASNGMKKQEEAINELRKTSNISVAIGSGGSIDMIIGIRNEPPQWIRSMGIEWLYRVMQRPKRQIGRIANVIRFARTCINSGK